MNLFIDTIFAVATICLIVSLPHLIEHMNRREEIFRQEEGE